MLSLLIGAQAPQQDIIKLITEKPPAIVEVVEPTLDEKIASNYYKCNEAIEWIRADTAECLPKQQAVQVTTPAQTTVKRAVGSSQGNLYEPGQCTFWVKSKRPDIPNNWGHAGSWLGNAQRQGWASGSTPMVGAIGWTPSHVVFIEAVNSDGTVTYSDMNGRFIAWEIGGGTAPSTRYTYIY